MTGAYADLRDSDGDPDVDAIIGEFFPYDGPYSDWTTGLAARMVAGLIRYLNNATQKRSALSNGPTLGRIVSQLSATAFGLDQLVDQLGRFSTRLADDPTLYDDHAPGEQGGATALALRDALTDARTAAAALAMALDRANGLGSRLGHRGAAQ